MNLQEKLPESRDLESDDVKAVLRRKNEVEEEVRKSSLSVQLSVASVNDRAFSQPRA